MDSSSNPPPHRNVHQPSHIQVSDLISSSPSTPTAFQHSSLQPPGTSSPSGHHVSRRHPTHRGIRWRSGKWVSEIREPRKTTRIWLGTYPTADMAASAYDVAALALKGPNTHLNFPNLMLSYPIPASLSATDIREAAAAAARVVRPAEQGGNVENESSSSSYRLARSEQFIDEDELLNMPYLLDEMARGMQVSPPRMNNSPSSDDSPGISDGDSLWSYSF